MSLTWIKLRCEPRDLDGGETLISGPRLRPDGIYIGVRYTQTWMDLRQDLDRFEMQILGHGRW